MWTSELMQMSVIVRNNFVRGEFQPREQLLKLTRLEMMRENYGASFICA
jgi:hypothetical protein